MGGVTEPGTTIAAPDLPTTDGPAPGAAAAELPGTELGDVTVTTLVHRGTKGTPPWWHSPVVYSVPGRLGKDAVDLLAAEISHLARLGADALQFKAPELDLDDEAVRESVLNLVKRAHQRSIKVITTVLGTDAPTGADPTGFHLARTTAWLDLGVDGVDVIDPVAGPAEGPHSHAGIDLGAVQALLAERSDDAVVTGAASATNPECLRSHLQEDWLHITRDDRLAVAGWSAQALRQTITDSYVERDRVGVPAGWTIRGIGAARGAGPEAATDESSSAWRRRLAATFLMLALPGAAYIRQGAASGIAVPDDDAVPVESLAEAFRLAAEQRGNPGSSFETHRHALRLRHELRLGTGHLAWVDGAGGPGALVFVNRKMLVVTNLGADPVHVPADRELLHSSVPLTAPVEGYLAVPTDTTAWFALD